MNDREEPTLDAQATAIAKLPPDMAILKIENDQIFALASARPRDFPAIKAELAMNLTSFPQLAADAIYCKPVGKDEGGNMKFARNLSIRAAEALAEAYGFNRTRSDVEPMGEDGGAKVTSSFTDYQKGRVWQDSAIIPRVYKDRKGRMTMHPEDRFWNVVVKAQKSILIREVILRSVNAGLKAWFFSECERLSDELLGDVTIDKIVANFGSLSVTKAELEAFVGRSVDQGWTKTDRRRLGEIWNALEQEETTVSEVFRGGTPAGTAEAQAPEASQEKAEAKVAEAVAGGAVKVEAQPEQRREETPRKKAMTYILNASTVVGKKAFDKVLADFGVKAKDLASLTDEQVLALALRFDAAEPGA